MEPVKKPAKRALVLAARLDAGPNVPGRVFRRPLQRERQQTLEAELGSVSLGPDCEGRFETFVSFAEVRFFGVAFMLFEEIREDRLIRLEVQVAAFEPFEMTPARPGAAQALGHVLGLCARIEDRERKRVFDIRIEHIVVHFGSVQDHLGPFPQTVFIIASSVETGFEFERPDRLQTAGLGQLVLGNNRNRHFHHAQNFHTRNSSLRVQNQHFCEDLLQKGVNLREGCILQEFQIAGFGRFEELPCDGPVQVHFGQNELDEGQSQREDVAFSEINLQISEPVERAYLPGTPNGNS